jgi:hypothetical protein
MEAPLMPVTGGKTFRPPRADAPLPAPKQSAAPVPRLRPSAPATRGQPLAVDVQESPADQLAEMLAAQRETAVQPTPSATATMMLPTPASLRATTIDPLYFRKMIIPILFTFGLCMAGWAVLIFTSGEDSAMQDMFPHWLATALLAVAGFFILLALINMLAVRKDMRAT